MSLDDAARGPVQAGSQVTQGAPLFGLASIERLKIVARVSELDVNQLREGMAVDVQGDGFEGEALHGTVSVVGGQALPSTQGGAQFEVMVAIPDLNEQMRRVRLGMSARLSILAYRNESAMVVPRCPAQRGRALAAGLPPQPGAARAGSAGPHRPCDAGGCRGIRPGAWVRRHLRLSLRVSHPRRVSPAYAASPQSP